MHAFYEVRLSFHALIISYIGNIVNIINELLFLSRLYLTPEFTASVEQGATGSQVRLDFMKHGHDGIWIENRINGGEWKFLSVSTIKPYLDVSLLATGNNHEAREYRMRWWDKSVAHGEWSGVQAAVLGS